MINSNSKIKIIIADDVPEFIDGIKLYFENQQQYEIIADVSNGLELITHPLLKEADILLVDCEMPIINGIETAKRINYLFPRIKMIAITMYHDKVYLKDLIGAGFVGFVNKTEISTRLHTVIQHVLTNKTDFADDLKL